MAACAHSQYPCDHPQAQGDPSNSHSQELVTDPEDLVSISDDHLQASELNQGAVTWSLLSTPRQRKAVCRQREGRWQGEPWRSWVGTEEPMLLAPVACEAWLAILGSLTWQYPSYLGNKMVEWDKNKDWGERMQYSLDFLWGPWEPLEGFKQRVTRDQKSSLQTPPWLRVENELEWSKSAMRGLLW